MQSARNSSKSSRFPRARNVPHRLTTTALALCILTSCATIPKPLQGAFAPLLPTDATARDATGQAVRWGGTLATVEPLAGETCFQVVGHPLDASGRPHESDRGEGRFIACRQGFYEPQIFAQGRSITVTGHIVGYESRRVGEYDYRQPKVAADVIYLWPRRDVAYADPYYDRRFGPPWPGMWWRW